ncbi:MAG: hypothetical protein ABH812_00905 [bacterium]
MGKERLESIIIGAVGLGFAGFLAISGVRMVGQDSCSKLSSAEQYRNNPAYEHCLREDVLIGTAGYGVILLAGITSTGTIIGLANKK